METAQIPDSAASAPPSPRAAAPGPRIVLHIRPHPLFVILRSLGALGIILGLGAMAWWLADIFQTPAAGRLALIAGAAIVGLLLAWNILVWSMREYMLIGGDDRGEARLVRTAGVLRRSRMELALQRVQHIVVYRSLRERLFGLGTLGFSAAGTGWIEMVWAMVEHPEQRLAQVREAMAAEKERQSNHTPPPRPRRSGDHLPVIGLAGGIGAGKSEVARILGELGCFVIDSDRQAREALDRPDVREHIVQWWGRGILNDSGRVNRGEVAKIVFGDDRERQRLERLVHPLVRARRAELIEQARAAGAPAAVVDAPLLFEAGVDKECDVIIFVDAPRDLRLKRVRDTRGWDEAELDRRQRAQLPLRDKCQRSDFVIINAGDRQTLTRQVEKVLAEVLKK